MALKGNGDDDDNDDADDVEGDDHDDGDDCWLLDDSICNLQQGLIGETCNCRVPVTPRI